MWGQRKYRNKKTARGFDSKKEERRFDELVFLEANGKISGLERQKTFRIEINGILVCKYIADFCYTENGENVVEDVKSDFTKKLPVYRLKNKLMRAVLGIEVKET